jgi:hypothetical protein
MNAELLKSFENVINYYKTKPEYLDIVGTELYKKMCDLESEILEFCGVIDNFESCTDKNVFKCNSCGKYFVWGLETHNCIKAQGTIDTAIEEQSLRLMFHDEDCCNRLIDFPHIKEDPDEYGVWNICDDCCEFYGYDTTYGCHISEVEEKRKQREEERRQREAEEKRKQREIEREIVKKSSMSDIQSIEEEYSEDECIYEYKDYEYEEYEDEI